MVQMKAKTEAFFRDPDCLYIPHGSDERLAWRLFFKKLFSLYIPHGSDERDLTRRPSKVKFDFISHMVQMKGLLLL